MNFKNVPPNVPKSIPGSLSNLAAGGAFWLLLQSLSSRATALISQLVLAWILKPDAFGTIGLVFAVAALSSALFNFGIDDLLVQRSKTLRFWLKPAYVTNSIISTAGCLLTCCAGFLASRLYDSEDLLGCTLVYAVSILSNGLQIGAVAKLRSELNFRVLTKINISENLAVQLLSIICACLHFGAYSFVVPISLCSVIKLFVLQSISPSRPKRRAKIRQYMYLAKNGLAILLTRSIISLYSQGDYIILGLFASRAEIGSYYFAFRLAVQPLWLLAGNLTGVLFPTLVKLRSDVRRQAAALLETSTILSYIIIPICFLQAAVSDPVLRMLFGNKWLDSIPILQALSIGLGFDAVSWATGSMLNANREYKFAFKLTLSFLPLFLISSISGAYFNGALGMALGMSIFYALMGPIQALIVFERYGVPLVTVAELMVLPAILSILSIGGVYYATSNLSDLFRLILIGVIAPSIYFLLVNSFKPSVVDNCLFRFQVRHIIVLKFIKTVRLSIS